MNRSVFFQICLVTFFSGCASTPLGVRELATIDGLMFDPPPGQWQRSKTPHGFSWSQNEGEGRSVTIGLWYIEVPSQLRQLNLNQHAVQYFTQESHLPRTDGKWSHFDIDLSNPHVIQGKEYPAMSFHVELPNSTPATEGSGIYFLYFPPDFREQQKFYVVMWVDIHPVGQAPAPLNMVYDVITSFRIKQ